MIALAAPIQASTREATLTDTRAADRGQQFSTLVTARLDRAYRLAGLVLADAGDAEDAVGDAIVRAWAGFGKLRDPAGFDVWFDRILLNVCRDRLRRRKRVRFIPLGPGLDRPMSGDPFRRVLDLDDVLRTMRDLDDDERLVVVLHFWADLTLTDVAARIGVPAGTVKSRLSRALQRMRPMAGFDELEEHGS